MRLKPWLLCHLNKGQIFFVIIGIVLILFVSFVIMLGNITISSIQFSFVFKQFVSLRSLAISGLRYALYQINQNPNFTTTSAQVLMPQGRFTYSVSNINQTTKSINVQANLINSSLSRILKATATIDNLGTILNLEISEE